MSGNDQPVFDFDAADLTFDPVLIHISGVPGVTCMTCEETFEDFEAGAEHLQTHA